MLSNEEKKILIDIAHRTLNAYISDAKILSLDHRSYSETLTRKYGAFVTLYKKTKLRGCIGRLTSGDYLYKLIRDMTISAASRDNRFNTVTLDELNEIKIEISVLSELEKVTDISEIELGKHGIYIKKGMNSGTFLPDVASNTGWDLEQFLGHCARDKAHIGWNGWKNADVFKYETISFGDNGS